MKWQDEINENIKFGLVEILIMALLTKEDMYGYKLKMTLAEKTNGAITMKEGSLYGPLYRMEERKLISSRKELVGEKRFRVYYHIEPLGKEYLDYAVKMFRSVYGGANQLLQEFYANENEQKH